jgi:spore coat protein A
VSAHVKLGRRRFLVATGALVAPWACRGGSIARRAPAPQPPPPSPPAAVPPGLAPPPRPPLHPDALARFVDRLPIPPVLRPDGLGADPRHPGRQIDLFRVTMREARARVHRDLPPTRFWTYGGSVPGPTIETRSGRGLLIEWRNELPERHFLPIDHGLCGAGASQPHVRTVVHVHGAKAPPESDGYPDTWYTPGHAATYHYPNQQDAATLWYHDHAMGIERLNHYAGMFGLFLIRDELEDALDLPRGPHEIPLVICDRLFDADGQLRYPTSGVAESPWVSEVYGDAFLVNGKIFPYLEVEPRRYRLRVVNASNSRPYYLSLSNGQTFHQIGTDQGLLPAPAALQSLTLASAERADLIIDFSRAAGQTVILRSQAFQLMQFRVGARSVSRAGNAGDSGDAGNTGSSGKLAWQTAEPADWLPARLRPVVKIPLSAAVKRRTLTLNEYMDPKTHVMLMLLNGTRWHEPVTERPQLDSVELWSLVNLTEDTHPIHLHLVRFQIVDRQPFDADEYLTSGTMLLQGKPVPPPPNEAGWKDTVRADPGTVTRIIARFEGYPGRYVWHCHLLEHAANEMMRPFEVVARSSR